MTAATRAHAQPPRATAAECLLPVTSQPIRKHLRDRGVGAGVGPEFMSKQNSELIGKPGRKTDGAVSLEIGDKHVGGEGQADVCLIGSTGIRR